MDFSSFRVPYREDKIFGWLFFLCLAVPLVFDVYNFEAYETIKFGLLIVTAGGLLAAVFFKKRGALLTLTTRLDKKIFLITAAFIVWSFLSALFAIDHNYAWFGFYPRFTNGFLFLFLTGIVFLLTSFVSREKIKTLIKVLFFCSVLTSVWGLSQSMGYGFYSGISAELFSRGAPSFMGNPNFAAMFVASLIPMGLWLWAQAQNKPAKYYYLISIFIQVCAVVIFSSRGALMALVAGLGATLLLNLLFLGSKSLSEKSISTAIPEFRLQNPQKCSPIPRHRLRFFRIFRSKFWNFATKATFQTGSQRKKMIVLSLGILLAVGLLSGIFLNFLRPGTLASSLNFTDTNIQQRFGIWKMSLYSFTKHPVLGFGLSNFELAFEQNRSISGLKIGFFDDPHNLFLYYLVSGGLPLLLFFLAFIGYPLFLGLKKISRQSDSDNFNFSLLGAVTAWLVAAFFTPVAIPCFVLLIILLSGFFEREQPLPEKLILALKPWASGLAVILILAGVGFIAAEHLFFASIKSYNAGNFKTAAGLAKTAIYLNPTNNLYYEYEAASYIREGGSEVLAQKAVSQFLSFHKTRAYSYVQLANLNYLFLYQTRDSKYIPIILNLVQKAISIDPYSASNYFSLAEYNLIFARTADSIDSIKKGLRLSPTSNAWMFLAKAYQAENNRQGVIDSIYQAIKIEPGSDSLQTLLHLAGETTDIRKLPFNVQLNVGTLDN